MQQGSSGAVLSRPAVCSRSPLLYWDGGGGGSSRNCSSIRALRGAAEDPRQRRFGLPRGHLVPIPLPPHLLHRFVRRFSTDGRLRRRPLQPTYSRLSDCGGGCLETNASNDTATRAIGAAAGATTTALMRDLGATCLTIAGAYCLVLVFDNLTKRRIVEQTLSRKLVHVLSGVMFLLTWPMFSSSPEARFFAAVVPLLNCLRLLAYGLALAKDDALIKSVTRQGKREELLKGPLYYVVVLLVSILVFWRDSPVGIMAVCMMSGGDGFADIVGRRFGSSKLPFNEQKSWAGSIGMFVFGFAISLGMLYYYWTFGFLPSLDWEGGDVALKVAFIALVATAVESLPLTESVDDNLSVPLASMLAAMVAFGSP